MRNPSRKYTRWIQETPLWYRAIYICAYAYYWYLTLFPASSKKENREIKKVIIIYSKNHFNPTEDSARRLLAFNSAANLARNIYTSLNQNGAEVIYRDQKESLVETENVDMIFGILSASFEKYCRKYPDAKKVLFLVNSHPLFRLKTLSKEAQRNNVRLPRSEYISPFGPLRCLRAANNLLLIGNETVRHTFIDFGCFGKEIGLINSGVNTDILVPDSSKLPTDKIRLLFCATDLGIRKGLFRLMSLWKKIAAIPELKKIELIVLGGNVSFKKQANDFLQKYPEINYHGWIDSTSDEYRTILQSAHIILGLSLEEGQVGSILEAMSAGAIPLITPECGIPFSSTTYNEDLYISKLKEYVTMTPAQLEEKRRQIRSYILQNHSWEIFCKKIKSVR